MCESQHFSCLIAEVRCRIREVFHSTGIPSLRFTACWLSIGGRAQPQQLDSHLVTQDPLILHLLNSYTMVAPRKVSTGSGRWTKALPAKTLEETSLSQVGRMTRPCSPSRWKRRPDPTEYLFESSYDPQNSSTYCPSTYISHHRRPQTGRSASSLTERTGSESIPTRTTMPRCTSDESAR